MSGWPPPRPGENPPLHYIHPFEPLPPPAPPPPEYIRSLRESELKKSTERGNTKVGHHQDPTPSISPVNKPPHSVPSINFNGSRETLKGPQIANNDLGDYVSDQGRKVGRASEQQRTDNNPYREWQCQERIKQESKTRKRKFAIGSFLSLTMVTTGFVIYANYQSTQVGRANKAEKARGLQALIVPPKPSYFKSVDPSIYVDWSQASQVQLNSPTVKAEYFPAGSNVDVMGEDGHTYSYRPRVDMYRLTYPNGKQELSNKGSSYEDGGFDAEFESVGDGSIYRPKVSLAVKVKENISFTAPGGENRWVKAGDMLINGGKDAKGQDIFWGMETTVFKNNWRVIASPGQSLPQIRFEPT